MSNSCLGRCLLTKLIRLTRIREAYHRFLQEILQWINAVSCNTGSAQRGTDAFTLHHIGLNIQNMCNERKTHKILVLPDKMTSWSVRYAVNVCSKSVCVCV